MMMPAKRIKRKQQQLYSKRKPVKQKIKQLHCNHETKQIYKPLITTHVKKKHSFRKKILCHRRIAMNSTATEEKCTKAHKNWAAAIEEKNHT